MKKLPMLLLAVAALALAACDLGTTATQDPKYQDKAVDQTKFSESGTPAPGIQTGTPVPSHK